MITIIIQPEADMEVIIKKDQTHEVECITLVEVTTKAVVGLHTITRIIMIIIAKVMKMVRAIIRVVIIIERGNIITVDSITMADTMIITIASITSTVVAIISSVNLLNMKNLEAKYLCSNSQDTHLDKAISVVVDMQSVALPNPTTIKDNNNSLDNHLSKFLILKTRLDPQKFDYHLCQNRITFPISLTILKVNIQTITRTTRHRLNNTINHPTNYNNSSYNPRILPLHHSRKKTLK